MFELVACAYMVPASCGGGAPAPEVMPRAREAAPKALALDDRSGEAHGALGFFLLPPERRVGRRKE
jgi:hypothetical protein